MAVRIVTDSTADILPAEADAAGVAIVPLTVFFGDEAYLDNVELDNAGFYKKLQASKTLPSSSQPSPAAFQEAFKRLIQEGADGILSVHLSSKLSGTYQSACTARDTLPDELKHVPIEVIDSQSISVGMAYAILIASRQAKEGKGLEEIKTELVDRISRTRILAVLDTLEYVRRGGRIGGAQAMLGNMLSVKPIISLRDGSVVPVEQPRTRSKAFARIVQLVGEMGPLEHLTVAESDEEVGRQLAEQLKNVYPEPIPTMKLGAVIGTHTGPGTAAIAAVTAPR